MDSREYDFVIVGGGTAGLVLAARLSEHPHHHVLVIEAGQDQSSDSRVTIPALWPTMVGTASDWSLKTVKQEGLNNRALAMPQGRLLGGSSALNGLTFTPNSQVNTDAWAKLGNPGWDWSHMSRYFKKSHTINKPSDPATKHLGLGYLDDTISGTEGPIQLSFPEDTDNVWSKTWIETLTGLGHRMSADPFSGKSYGGYVNAEAVDPVKRQRSYAGNAYLKPARGRSNLTVATGALVQEVILEKSNDGQIAAKGVAYLQDGAERRVQARKEVILCAGCFNTPKILELSGIGDSHRLQQLGISTIVHNPNVGENLQNHLLVSFSLEVVHGVQTLDPIARQDQAAIGAAMEAYSKQTGPFTNSGTYASALLPLFDFPAEDEKSKLGELFEFPTAITPPKRAFDEHHYQFVRHVLESPQEASGTYISFPGHMGFNPDGSLAAPIQGPENYFTIAILPCYPLSRGSTHISSADISAQPSIDPRYLSHPLDLEILARHLRFAERHICNAEPLRSFLKPNGKRSAGAPSSFEDLDIAKKFIKECAVGAYHATGTCSMMPRELGGVLDARLRVYGVQGLRVCDASVIPLIPRSNPQATVYAVAERGADLIREDWDLHVA